MGIKITLERYDVQVLGRRFQFNGKMEPVGPVLDFFNDENRSTVPLYDVEILPIKPSAHLSGIKRPEITVSDGELGLIYFLDPEYRQRTQVMRHFDNVIAYTPYALLRGKFHRGVETRLRDLFDLMPGSFLVMTDASIFPTIDLPAPFPRQADFLIVNRFFVDLYHAA